MNFFSVKHALPFIVTSVFFLVVSLVVYGILSHTTELDVAEEIAYVELREGGFYPKDVRIVKGGSVIFSTTRDSYFWPASNLHPTHGTYSDFDPKKPIEPNSTWTFTFDRAGVWKYHDHLTPHFGGSITVEDIGGSVIERCTEVDESIECQQNLLFSELEKNGVESTYRLLGEMYNASNDFRRNCHYFAHNIGLESYKYYLEDETSVLSPEVSACAYGFYHGFMEALLTTTQDAQKAREFCLYIDEHVTPHAPDAGLQCFHGIGHGAIDLALAVEGYGSSERILVEDSLRICETAAFTEEEIYRCTSGIYNSIANAYVLEENIPLRENDPLWLCREQPEAYKESCYGNMNTLIFTLAEKDLRKALPLVSTIEEGHQVASMRYLSGLSVVDLLLGNTNYLKVLSVCREAEVHLVEPCIEGLAHGYLEHGIPGLEYTEAIQFCGSDVLTEKEKHICFKYSLSNLQGWYSRSKAREICNLIEPTYQLYCNKDL